MKKSQIIKTSGSLLLTGFLAGSCNQTAKKPTGNQQDDKEKQNVIMFFTDDNAFWYWGFGGGPDLSPNIDQLAKDGVEATQFYCNSTVCTPSRYNLHTGKYAGRCQDSLFLESIPEGEMYSIEWNTFLNNTDETLMSHVLMENGYKTGFVGKWHLSPHEFYDKYHLKADDDPANPEVDKKLKASQEEIISVIKNTGFDYASSITVGNNDMHPVKALQHHNLEWYAKGAMDFIDKRSEDNEPFFLIINITTHHGPCHRESVQQDVSVTQAGYVDGLEGIMPPRNQIFDRIKEKGYDVDFKTVGTVWTDDMVKSVLDHLDKKGLTGNTSVVFTTDHNRYDGKATCYQGGVHIPFLMRAPGIIEPGSKCDARFQMTDLFPTFMDMCNIDMPENLKIDGKSFWNALQGKEQEYEHDALFFEFGYSRGVLAGDYKYITVRFPDDLLAQMKTGQTDKAFGITGKKGNYPNALRYPSYFEPVQLYNIKEDYEEQVNLIDEPEHAGTALKMEKLLAEKLHTISHPYPLDVIDEFLYSDQYKKMGEKAREETDMSKMYWWVNECY